MRSAIYKSSRFIKRAQQNYFSEVISCLKEQCDVYNSIFYDPDTASLNWGSLSPASEKEPLLYKLTVMDSTSKDVIIDTMTPDTTFNFTKPHSCGLYTVTVALLARDCHEDIIISMEIGHQG